MFQRLLVTLDGTAQAATALPVVRSLAVATGAAVVLLRVLPATRTSADQQRAAAEQNLRHIADELASAGLQVTARIREGDPASEIIEEVHSSAADGIVLAARAHAGPGQPPLGHVPEQVVARSPVPVLTVRPGGRRVTHIETLLVPMRGHPGSTMALGVAVKLARAVGARSVLLEVIGSVPTYVYEGGLLAGSIDPDWEQASRDSAQTRLESVASRLRATGIRAEGQVRMGPMPATLLDTADELGADIIVITSHAQEPPSTAAVSSLASQILRVARQPVLLIRHEVLQRTPARQSEHAGMA
jgi:nucleotide-binding universal stress UspA family protein